ncbi:MAG TPA: hypothetical protein VKN82_10680 [Desulfohalobiaceae bacterium]|nr:hypothetical protein [Desulfohalobiaceae bacterium]
MRKAATIILVRDKRHRLEVYLLKRSDQSGFMSGLYVFPGGTVGPEDMDLTDWAPYIDLSPDQIEANLCDQQLYVEEALGFAIAAIRETLEEAGVILANGKDKNQKDLENLSKYRLDSNLPKSWFKTRIMEEKWILSLSCLGKWSHWITPKLMKKRFDTRFFIAPMPLDQDCQTDKRETINGVWLDPQTALEKNLKGTVPLSPPTIVTLTQLLQFKTLGMLQHELKTRPWGEPLAPCLVKTSDGPLILEPWDPHWGTDNNTNPNDLAEKVLLPGSDFSRIWCDKGVWKPVGI